MSRTSPSRELSERLAELKQRSDRSYEWIGRKVDMSRSTVQRYCTGNSAPTEFGSLERIARACGADVPVLVSIFALLALSDPGISARQP